MDFADRRPHESEWLSTSSSNYSLTMIMPASCSCKHYSLSRFPTGTEICTTLCIRLRPLFAQQGSCDTRTDRQGLTEYNLKTTENQLNSYKQHINNPHSSQQHPNRL